MDQEQYAEWRREHRISEVQEFIDLMGRFTKAQSILDEFTVRTNNPNVLYADSNRRYDFMADRDLAARKLHDYIGRRFAMDHR